MKRKSSLLRLALSGLLLMGAVGFAATAAAAAYASKTLDVAPVKTEVKQISGVVYAQVPARGYPNVALQLDLLQPQTQKKLPAIVYITGGGFINANRDNGVQLRHYLAEKGYVVASITYRVAPAARFPEPLEDVKASIRYLRANAAKYNIDKDRIGVIGGSAGGYLSSFAGTTSGSAAFDKGDNLQESSKVNCAVNLYGLSDLTQVGMDYDQEVQALHKSPGATEALWVNGSPVFGGKDGGILVDAKAAAAANPITYINENSAPMLLMHGSADAVVSPGQTDLLYQALKEKGVPAERYVIPGAGHGGVYWVQDNVSELIGDFFDKYLKQ